MCQAPTTASDPPRRGVPRSVSAPVIGRITRSPIVYACKRATPGIRRAFSGLRLAEGDSIPDDRRTIRNVSSPPLGSRQSVRRQRTPQ